MIQKTLTTKQKEIYRRTNKACQYMRDLAADAEDCGFLVLADFLKQSQKAILWGIDYQNRCMNDNSLTNEKVKERILFK